MEPHVTVIVTVYNIEEYLDRFFGCLGAMTYENYEALIIDDGSTDNSLQKCRRYAERDSRIRVLTTEHIGISAARALALSELGTGYVTSLDGDDTFAPDYLRHLVDAAGKYGADMVISNVILCGEDGVETGRFTPRPEGFYAGGDRTAVLPGLLTEDRLNYLYGKLYKAEYLKKVVIEPGVQQGSDTMINFRYLALTDSLAVTENYDYNYFRYNSRSVTSYGGKDYYTRLSRINRFLTDFTKENGWLTDEMQQAIDRRFLLIGRHAVYRIMRSSAGKKEKEKQVRDVIYSEQYLAAYRRLEQDDALGSLGFEVIAPGHEDEKMRQLEEAYANMYREERRERRRERCPEGIKRLYRKLRGR